MGQHYHSRRRRAGRSYVIRAEGARKALSFHDQATRLGKMFMCAGADALPRRGFALWQQHAFARGKNATIIEWCWQFLASKVG
jgi:hypothetical protein